MNNFKKITITALVVGLLATILVFIDSLIAPLIVTGASFTWISFINWTTFSSSTIPERLKAVLGYIIGFFAANMMIYIGNVSILEFNILNTTLMTLFGVFIVNIIIMYLSTLKKLYLDSISGLIVGIAITFSKVSVGLNSFDFRLLLIILIYGILGLIVGHLSNSITDKLTKKLLKDKKTVIDTQYN